MFGWFRKKKPSHPLADLDETRALISTLAGSPPAKALTQIGAWLDSITQAREMEVQERWPAVDLLDRASVAPRRRLMQEALTPARSSKVADEKRAGVAIAFWKTLGAAYLRCIATLRAAEPDAELLAKDAMARIAARALRAAGIQLKWTYLRHAQVEPRIWEELGRACQFAEAQAVAELRAELYAEDRGASTAYEELLKALMLATASPYNLEAPQLHLAERFIAHFAGRFVLASKPSEECVFAFDLAAGKPPTRAREDMTAATMRFFGAGDGASGLAELIQEIRAKDGIPGELNLGGTFDIEAVLAVLAHLTRIWNAAPPVRGAERSAVATHVTVVPGLPNILRALELVAAGATLDPKGFAEQETWEVLDRSRTGYGVLVPDERASFEFDPVTGVRTASGDWLRIGSLVALREEGESTWRIGVVRRILYDDTNQRRAGIGMLEGAAAVVRLAPASGPRANEPERRRSAVLMAHASESDAEAIVLMRAGHFMATQRLAMRFEGRDFVLEPEALLEGGEDFDCARFKVIER
jgi:hypothetical protein